MSIELEFKRPGRVEIKVSTSKQGFVYVTVWQSTKRGYQHLANIYGVSPTKCFLIDHGDSWVLEVGEARFHLRPNEAQQVREQMGIQVYKPI